MNRSVSIDPEGEYIVGAGRWVLKGQELVDAVVAFNRKHSTECLSISPRPETPGFLCTLGADHPEQMHKAERHMTWGHSSPGSPIFFKWERKSEQVRYEERMREKAEREQRHREYALGQRLKRLIDEGDSLTVHSMIIASAIDEVGSG